VCLNQSPNFTSHNNPPNMARLSQFLTTVLAALSAVSASAVIDLVPSNFDDIVVNSGKPALVEFFAPWCGHCKNLAPVYEELADGFEYAKDKVTIAKVDADAEKSLGKQYGVTGFPTLKWFDGKGGAPVDYSSGRDLDSLTAFITDKTGVKPKGKKAAPSAVEWLTDTTFEEKIGGAQDVLVAFTAPWCGHCKTLAPTWEKLASSFASELNVLVAKVDCEAPNSKALAEKVGITGFPTIKFYPKGSKEAEAYSGGRSESDLVEYLNEKAGTFRLPGGGLNTLAGVIPSLDEVVGSLKSGGEKAYTEFYKVAGDLQGKYAEYYSKVGHKLQENKDYANKEFKRLQGLIRKGSLAPEKLDDLVTRSNILNVFRGEKAGKDEL